MGSQWGERRRVRGGGKKRDGEENEDARKEEQAGRRKETVGRKEETAGKKEPGALWGSFSQL